MSSLANCAGSAPVLAYIDPGTGSALLYVIAGLIVSIYFAVRGLYYRIMATSFRRRDASQRCNIAIHSEDPRYEITFLPIVRALAERGAELTYFCMYERDASFEALPPRVKQCTIPSGMLGYAYLNNLEANVLVTTTPQLDVMTFRRSKRVKHYCHVPHALGECRYVRPYAYDFFDSVMCCGETLKRNIRRMEWIRKLPPKELYKTGIPHYDELSRSAGRGRGGPSLGAAKRQATILIAPSWGPLSLFQAFGTGIVEAVAKQYPVIVRPHPQMKVSQPDVYARVLALEGVIVDTSRTPEDAMSRADLLISDISGIMHEFAFIHEKPVIIVDHELGVEGLEGQLLGGESELKRRCRQFIIPIDPSEIADICARIEVTLRSHSPDLIPAARSQLIYNFGDAGSVAAQQLHEIARCL